MDSVIKNSEQVFFVVKNFKIKILNLNHNKWCGVKLF